jgi:hypothetical protein
MSVYPNQTNVSPGSALFIPTSGGSIANFTSVNALTSISTPSLFISSINNGVYPPAGGQTIVTGKLTIDQGFGATISVPGCLSTSVPLITPCITNGGDPNVLLRCTAGTNQVEVAWTNQVPGGTIINYAVFI